LLGPIVFGVPSCRSTRLVQLLERGSAHDKAKTGVKGRTAYRKFMGDRLKKTPA
jgi:hypothetical protein